MADRLLSQRRVDDLAAARAVARKWRQVSPSFPGALVDTS
jgi:hypothetical protein